MLIVVILLVIIIGALVAYNFAIYKKLKELKRVKQEVLNLDVVQGFMSTIGNQASVDDKIKRVNEIIVEQYKLDSDEIKFNIKYSTIVIFDGTKDYHINKWNLEEQNQQCSFHYT